MSAALEHGLQLLWGAILEKQARILERREKAKELEISLNQILSERLYSDPQDQAHYEHTMSLCTRAALKDLDRIQKQ